MFLTLVRESSTGSGPVKSIIAACCAKLSAISFPLMLLCPRVHNSQTQLWRDKLCSFVTVSQTNADVDLAIEIDFNVAWLFEQIVVDLSNTVRQYYLTHYNCIYFSLINCCLFSQWERVLLVVCLVIDTLLLWVFSTPFLSHLYQCINELQFNIVWLGISTAYFLSNTYRGIILSHCNILKLYAVEYS